MSAFEDSPMPIIASGRGCRLTDIDGKDYLDALSGLFVVQAGYGRAEIAAPASAQAEDLAYFPLWGYAHEPAIRLAERLANLAPGDINRVFLTVSGSESVETALKMARQYHRLRGQVGRYKVISRAVAYHGVSLGALSVTGVPQLRAPFEPLLEGFHKTPNTNPFRPPLPGLAGTDLTDYLISALEQTVVAEGPDTIAAIVMEPLQNAGGCFVPPPGYFQRVRELCDRYGILLVSDEVICAFGRLGHYFGCERYGYQPDIITTAKGITSGYTPLGAVLTSDRVMEPFLGEGEMFTHGLTFGGHPVSCAVALANLDVFERESLCDAVLKNERALRDALCGLMDMDLVGDVRGDGYFWAIEMVPGTPDRQFTAEQKRRLVRGIVTPELRAHGLIARADDRFDPVIQFAPPLIAGPEEFDEIADKVRRTLDKVDLAELLA
jgi:adenosylmethionine-8-amino-7-oxononanoate aminotransferase